MMVSKLRPRRNIDYKKLNDVERVVLPSRRQPVTVRPVVLTQTYNVERIIESHVLSIYLFSDIMCVLSHSAE